MRATRVQLSCGETAADHGLTALLQTYGLRIDAFSLNRAPGGTFGNRNFMAHLCVIVFPALLLSTLRAQSPRAFGWWGAALATVAGALVLSRSRAAWLALIACVVVLAAFAYLVLRRTRGSFRMGASPRSATTGSRPRSSGCSASCTPATTTSSSPR